MKFIIYFTLLLIISFQSYSQSIKKKIYKSKFGVFKIEDFDINENLIRRQKCFDNKCIKADVKVNIYNNKNQLIEDSIYTNEHGYHQLIWRKKYTYYPSGLLYTEIKVNKNCSTGYDDLNTYFYDKNDKLIKIYKQDSCDNKHSFDYPVYFKYNSFGIKLRKLQNTVTPHYCFTKTYTNMTNTTT